MQNTSPHTPARPEMFAIWNNETFEFQIGGFAAMKEALSGAFPFTNAKNIPADSCPEEVRHGFLAIGYTERGTECGLMLPS